MSGNSGRTLTVQRRKSGANLVPTEAKEDGTESEFEDEKIKVDP